MSYQVLIVDDEPLIRQGIKNKLDWDKFQINILEEACDGIEALEKINSLNPEIVITDIKMPEMDGLLLIEEADKQGFNPYFIIISGYAEFDYAKKAIVFGVEDYLLKPISSGELESAIVKIIAKIEQENEIKQRLALGVSGSTQKINVDSNENNFSGEDIVNESVNFIHRYFKEDITLKSLAQKYFINENYLCRIFKIVTGKSFNDYLTEVRIRKACELLEATKLNITEISKLVGYEPKYFSKVFKKEMGVSPIEYVGKNRS